MIRRFAPYIAALAGMVAPIIAHAHEVYVLTPEEIQRAIATPAFSEWDVILQNLHQFIFWGLIGGVMVVFVFFASLWRIFEKTLAPLFAKLRPHAATVSRVTVGISLVAASYYGALFGPELPLATFGDMALVVRGILAATGILLVFNLYPRIAALVMLGVFCAEMYLVGPYMITYSVYAGELLGILLLSSQSLAPYKFLILRVTLGVGLLFSSFYAKILHNALALQVASVPLAGHQYSIAQYLGFEPHFLVLGAAIVEIVMALFLIFGVELRFVSLFLLFWLSLSLGYFGEVVWPHLVLIGIPLALLCYGYDKFTLENYLFKRLGRTPW